MRLNDEGGSMSTWSEVSTDEVAQPDRLALWADSLWRLLGRSRSDANADAPFHGRMVHSDLGGLKLCRLSASRHRVVRTPDLIRQDNRGLLKMVVQLEGSAWFEQSGRKALLSAGEWSIYDTARPYSVSNITDVEQLVLLVPREKVLPRGLDPDDSLVRQYSARTGIGRLACEQIRTAFDEMSTCDDETADELADSITHLIRHSLLERCGKPTDLSVRETLRDLIKSYVDRNLRDPGLSIERLTVAFNCTKRNLHKAFSGDGTTICNYIWRSRLERCRRDLDNPACSAKSITDVAFFWGFSSSTHFSRAFKEAFGVSPRAYRLLRRSDCSPFEIPQSGGEHLLRAGYGS